MAVNSVDKSIVIAASPAAIYAEISDPNNMLGLQPLIVQVSPISRSQDNAGNTVLTYESVELFRFGGVLPYRNTIRVQSTLYPERNGMVSVVKSRPNVELEFTYVITAVEQGSRLDLTVRFSAPSLVRDFVLSQLNEAQDAVLVNLKARLEARS